MQYKRLFTVGRIGACQIKNRFAMTAMGCGLAELDGTLGEPFLAYYRERARGGVGMIVTEVTRVNEEHGCMDHRQIRASHDKFIPELKKLADCVHAFDCRVFVQLHHPGNVTYPGMNHGHTPVSASNVPSRIRRQEIHALTIDEIKELVHCFAEAARRAKEAGIDGVEIHAGHFYLIHQFLSPYFNKRTDEYGGSTENRSRFLLEIVAAIRKTCGDDYPVMARLSVEDYLGDEGYHLNEGIKIARLLEEAGVDAIDVTAGGNGGTRSQSLEPTSYRQGWRRHLGAAIKRSVNIPVITVSVVRDPGFAEEMLEKGQTDFVGSGRCYLADPDYVAKIHGRREGEIRRCISCLRCIENIKDERSVVCSVNPDCGAESEQQDYARDGSAQKVIVLGGGPAGLEAARVAGERGFDVHLYEKCAELGGAMYLASKVPFKSKMLWFVDYEQRQCEKLGVHIHCNAELTVEQISMQQPYAVINATGALPVAPRSIPGIDQQIVCTNVDVLDGSVTPEGEHIAVIGSGLTGLETAEFLAENGNAVTIIEMAERVAPGANPANVNDVLSRLQLNNTVVMTGAALAEIGEDRIYIEAVRSKEKSEIPVDRVVLAMGVRPGNAYGDALNDTCAHVITIGDAVSAGRIMEAVRAGKHAAMSL